MYFREFILYAAGDAGYHECRIPALLATSKWTILAFNEARKFSGRDADEIDLVLRRSTDGGNTFGDIQILAHQEGWACHNLVPVQDRDTETIWLFFCKNPMHGNEAAAPDRATPRTVWLTHSRDEGETWSDPVEVTASVKRPEWVGYNTGPGHGIQMRSGRLVIPCVHGERHKKGVRGHAHVIYSDDHGASWTIGGSTGPNASESRVLETADGGLYLNCRSTLPATREGGHFRRVAWSLDGGETFSPLVHDGGLPEPICQAGLCRYAPAPGAPVGKGRTRVIFSNPGNATAGERHHLTIRMSYDECRTWPVSRVLYEGPSSYSDLCVAPDKTICCIYERGSSKGEGVSGYSGDIAFARFDLGWLTDGVVHARLLEDAL
jgi:sialidase-1